MRNKLLAATIFFGSFISFALEPMIGRVLLPVFGGTPTVWVTCLGTFQILMVGGYFYGERKMSRGSFILHLGLLVLAGVWCCALSSHSALVLNVTSTLSGIAPLDVFISVLSVVGFAFILLSANATVVQTLSNGDYRLYSMSNLGSLLGLFTYPLLIEPFIGLRSQWFMLGVGILLYAVLLFSCKRFASVPQVEMEHNERARYFHGYLYFLLPLLSCALLNAVTTHLTLDIAPIPLLWAVLLGLFLLSYVIGFSGRVKSIWWAIPAIASAFLAFWWHHAEKGNSVADQLPVSAALLFFVCTFIHTWLYELRPSQSQLGRYYLLNVIGGAVGGAITSIMAPLLFSSIVEFPVMIVLSAAIVIMWLFQSHYNRFIVGGATVISTAILIAACFQSTDSKNKGTIVHRSRGFFGTIYVREVFAGSSDGKGIKIHEFYHGETCHGVQVMRKEMEKMPTAYYTPYGCGYAIWGHSKYRENKPMRVNMIGLGMGVLCAYARANDYYRGYDVSPETFKLAQDEKMFTFVSHCSGKVDLSLCDARKGLEQELSNDVEPYDVIIVDAFTGDSIPYHLSTKEAIDLYFKLLKPDGVLCIHISNKHLDLQPYIKRIGLEYNIKPIVLACKDDPARLGYATFSAFFTRHPEKLRLLPQNNAKYIRINLSDVAPMANMPTDDKGSFLPLIHFW